MSLLDAVPQPITSRMVLGACNSSAPKGVRDIQKILTDIHGSDVKYLGVLNTVEDLVNEERLVRVGGQNPPVYVIPVQDIQETGETIVNTENSDTQGQDTGEDASGGEIETQNQGAPPPPFPPNPLPTDSPPSGGDPSDNGDSLKVSETERRKALDEEHTRLFQETYDLQGSPGFPKELMKKPWELNQMTIPEKKLWLAQAYELKVKRLKEIDDRHKENAEKAVKELAPAMLEQLLARRDVQIKIQEKGENSMGSEKGQDPSVAGPGKKNTEQPLSENRGQDAEPQAQRTKSPPSWQTGVWPVAKFVVGLVVIIFVVATTVWWMNRGKGAIAEPPSAVANGAQNTPVFAVTPSELVHQQEAPDQSASPAQASKKEDPRLEKVRKMIERNKAIAKEKG